MYDSLQDLYAKNLRQPQYGFPLRTPEPSNDLPESYQDDGLRIGDVGFVDTNGRFHVYFNITHSHEHELYTCGHKPSRFRHFLPIRLAPGSLESDVNPHAIPPGHVISSPDVVPQEQPRQQTPKSSQPRIEYEFVHASSSGAILILPLGATSIDLKEHGKDEFRRIAVEQGRAWCGPAGRDSLYLITGLYKARTWSLASFHGVSGTGKIQVMREDDGPDQRTYTWLGSGLNWRNCSGVNSHPNQSVFISGFKIAVKWWIPGPMVAFISRPKPALFLIFLSALFSTLGRRRRGNARIEDDPPLSPPFHPSDVINRFLLDKNPGAKVAVTHDSQWINMVEKGGLAYEVLTQNEEFIAFLSHYTDAAGYENTVRYENEAVFLQSRRAYAGSEAITEPLSERSITSTLALSRGFLSAAPANDTAQFVITCIRAENIIVGLRRNPVGFCILVEFENTKRRTRNKPLLVHDSVIEWDDEIILPSNPSLVVQFTFCASFEIEPMLGSGESLCTSVISVGDLLDQTSLIVFSPRDRKVDWCSSLLVAVEQRRYNHWRADLREDNNLSAWEWSSSLAQATDKGHDALLRYHRHGVKEDLDHALKNLKHAFDICPANHPCRAVVLCNLAMAESISCQVDGTNLAAPILHYQNALVLRQTGHPDRAMTLLRLAQALLYHYAGGEQGWEETVASEIERILAELMLSCDSRTHEYRATELACQMHKRCKVGKTGTLAELDALIPELRDSIQLPPGDHFDKPHRLYNLGAVLLRRFKRSRDVSDIDQAISRIEDALQLIPKGDPARPSITNALCIAHRARSDLLEDSLPTDRQLGSSQREFIRNVVIAGETGVDKRALINLVVGVDCATVADDVRGATAGTQYLDWVVSSTRTYRLWDIPRLGEGSFGIVPPKQAQDALRSLLIELNWGGEVHLLILCMRGLPSVTMGMKQTYDVVTRIRDKTSPDTPLVAVITELENKATSIDTIPSMEEWWTDHAEMLQTLDMSFSGHACITTLPDNCPPLIPRRRSVCQTLVRKLILDHSPPARTNPPNDIHVLLFGETGVGKSSLINLLAGRQLATISPDNASCTLDASEYQFRLGSTTISLWDTVGLEDPEKGPNGYVGAIKKVLQLIRRLNTTGGVSLLLLCVRGSRFTSVTQSNYRLFFEILGKKKIPIALAVTHLEEETDMEDWWQRKGNWLKKNDLVFIGHTCITTLESHPKYSESRQILRSLLSKFEEVGMFLMPSEAWFGRASKGLNTFNSVEESFSGDSNEDLVVILRKRCGLHPDVARRVAACIEYEDALSN